MHWTTVLKFGNAVVLLNYFGIQMETLLSLCPQGCQQCLRTCVAIITWRIVLASNGESPRMLL